LKLLAKRRHILHRILGFALSGETEWSGYPPRGVTKEFLT
jgi:hypothetical protein